MVGREDRTLLVTNNYYVVWVFLLVRSAHALEI